MCTCTCVFIFRRASRCLFLQAVWLCIRLNTTICKHLVCFSEREKDRWWQSFNRPMKTNLEMLILTKIKTRHVKMYNANIYSVQRAAYSTYFSLTHIHMDLNMHEQCGRHLNTVPEALVVTLNVLDASAEFSPSRPALQSLSPLLHPASLVPLPGEPLNPGEEHIVSTCLSAHAR